MVQMPIRQNIMASLNKVLLIGNLGGDPELRFTGNGTAVCNFSIATTRKWKKDGETQEETEWHRIVAWGKLAEICEQYLSKGSQAYIEGEIRTRTWEDREGNTRYTVEIVADSVQFIRTNSNSDDRGSSDRGGRSNRDDRGGRNNRDDRGGRGNRSQSRGKGQRDDQPPLDDSDIPF